MTNQPHAERITTTSTKPHYHIALVLLWRDTQILATKRRADAEHLPDFWEFPGGKCAPGETPQQAAVREAREELGVEIEITGARAVLHFDYPARQVTLHPFDAKIIAGQAQPRCAAALAWLEPGELRDADFPPANAPLLAALRATPEKLKKTRKTVPSPHAT